MTPGVSLGTNRLAVKTKSPLIVPRNLPEVQYPIGEVQPSNNGCDVTTPCTCCASSDASAYPPPADAAAATTSRRTSCLIFLSFPRPSPGLVHLKAMPSRVTGR